LKKYIEAQKYYNNALSRVRKEAKIKDCFHYDKNKCKLPFKNAHSLQRQGALKILEQEKNGNRYLYAHTERYVNPEHSFLDLKPVGRKSASTFFGFCDYHDTTLFSSIENEPECTDIESDEHCFLHSYRSFAHSYHRKHEDWKLHNTTDPITKKMLIKGYGNYGERGFENGKLGIKTALNDFNISKIKLDKMIEEKRYDRLDYYTLELDYTAPIACAAATTPEYTFSKKPINFSTDPNYEYSPVITTVLPFSNRTIIILAVFPDQPNGVMFLDEIDNIKYELILQKYLSFHLINHAENCYLSPHFYEKKSLKWKIKYCSSLDHMLSSTTPVFTFSKKFPINYFSRSEAINE